MQTKNPILDDLAKVASSAMGAASGVRGEVESRIREQFERILSRMDIVAREEFEVMKAIALAARDENEALKLRVKDLEDRLQKLEEQDC